MTKEQLIEELTNRFVKKFGYDEIVDIKPVDMSPVRVDMFSTSTPRVMNIKVNKKGSSWIVNHLQFYVDFWGYGWTDDPETEWYKQRKEIVDSCAIEALCNALGVEIEIENVYSIVE